MKTSWLPIAFGLSGLVALACSEAPSSPPETPSIPAGDATMPALIVSGSLASGTTGGAGIGAGVTYVSVAPGTLPGAVTVRIRNLTAGEGAVGPVRLVEGGFDPVAVPARAGDRLELAFTYRAGGVTYEYATVPPRRPPTIVRISPPKGRTAVPLDVHPWTAFSEPVDPATLPAGIRLVNGGVPVAGRVESPAGEPWAAEFVPEAPLLPGTTYTLVITRDVRDLDGDALETALSATFTTGGSLGSEPALGTIPDDAEIAFSQRQDGARWIYVARADGSGLTPVVQGDSPAWSPRGDELAFVSDRDGTPNVYTMTADGSVIQRTAGVSTPTSYGGATDPAWSPDGSAIAFSTLHDGAYTIATVDRANGSLTFVTDYPGYNAHPSWSPDGRRLAFVSDRDAYDFVYNIYTMNADGTGQTLRTRGFAAWPDLAWYLHPAWSPDGTMIAFVYGSLIRTGSCPPCTSVDVRFNVAIMSADGAFARDLAWAGDINWLEALDPGSLTWSPDGLGLAYTFVDCDLATASGCTNHRSVKYVSLDGEDERTIVANADSPSWRHRVP